VPSPDKAHYPRLLDLFCGAGGAAKGYQRAGFYVVGVDIDPQPNYCGDEFIQLDALALLDTYLSDGEGIPFDVIHASPPCQDHTSMHTKHDGHGNGWMLDATIDRLRPLTIPWIVENVPGPTVTMRGWWFVLCGSSFGLNVRRHRRFRSNCLLMPPVCCHDQQIPRFRSTDKRRGGNLATVVGVHGHVNYAGEAEIRNAAMGIDWMSQPELAQAIPPAYTEWIGARLLEAIHA
jgi:DNA (cytosine-5)-methyltransferase 1